MNRNFNDSYPLKHQIPSTKYQTNSNYRNSNVLNKNFESRSFVTDEDEFRYLNFNIIWNL